MKAVARLVFTYFTGNRILGALSLVGLVMVVVSFYLLRTTSQPTYVWGFATAGAGALIVGSTLMPLMFGRMAGSHLIGVLPHGRLKLLVSAFLTAAIVSIPAPLCVAFGYPAAVLAKVPTPAELAKVHAMAMWFFWTSWAGTFQLMSWLYLTLWFITSQRTVMGYVKGLLVVLIALFNPLRDIQNRHVEISSAILLTTVPWLVFGAGFLLWPHWKAHVARVRSSSSDSIRALVKPRVAGHEIDLVLGTANPWFLAAAQSVPITFAATIGFYSPAAWLYYLTIFSTVAGAIAGQAAERSRSLWLRGNWSRAELFAHVERSFWRHNSVVLAVLLALMVGIGTYTGLPVKLMAAGLPLLFLGTVLSTYLGLMITRGLRWVEAVLAIAVMMALMAVAILAARSTANVPAVVALEVVLACLALVLRFAARRRWASIDWVMCRPDRALSARHAA